MTYDEVYDIVADKFDVTAPHEVIKEEVAKLYELSWGNKTHKELLPSDEPDNTDPQESIQRPVGWAYREDCQFNNYSEDDR